MKKLLIVLAALALIAGLGVMQAEAAPTDTITVTVTISNISVLVTGADPWAIGNVALSSTTPSAVYNVDNDGNVRERMDISVSGSPPWTAGATAGADVFAMKYSVDGATWLGIPATGLATLYPLDPVQPFYLQFNAPTSTSSYDQQSITVTITANAVS